MSRRERRRKALPGSTDFVVLDRDALDRLDRPCSFCGQLIRWCEAPDAIDWDADDGWRFAHGVCARRMREIS